jgi:hypothetical protein
LQATTGCYAKGRQVMRSTKEFQAEVKKFADALQYAIVIGGLSWDEACATVGFINEEGKFVPNQEEGK